MSESSSEEENSERLKEAVWSFKPQDIKINGKDNDSNGRQSYRAEVSKHEHDGNELGTTPEFRSHVAKKLGVILDGSISEVFSENDAVKSINSKKREEEEEEEEEGFRLFSTSAPGKWMEQSLPPPPKRRPIPSSSDSDSEMEMRLREAAVSVSDLLSPSFQTFTETTEKKSGETEGGREDDDTIDTAPKKMKKKKKRKKSTEASEKVIDVSDGEADVQQTVVEDLPKKKKKKKKRTSLGEAENVV
ncbi:protein CUSTOS isoform X2 [Misgurnus anguillicaudatus]|uniref:protein CUSTOS isoform X2 n=1 Tax=Misgurnus anguillicaudatus TaxID=75329 RepID=UPI003CCF1DB4